MPGAPIPYDTSIVAPRTSRLLDREAGRSARPSRAISRTSTRPRLARAIRSGAWPRRSSLRTEHVRRSKRPRGRRGRRWRGWRERPVSSRFSPPRSSSDDGLLLTVAHAIAGADDDLTVIDLAGTERSGASRRLRPREGPRPSGGRRISTSPSSWALPETAGRGTIAAVGSDLAVDAIPYRDHPSGDRQQRRHLRPGPGPASGHRDRGRR